MATTTTLSYITTLGENQLTAAIGGTKLSIASAVFGSDIIINNGQTSLVALTNAVSSGNMVPVYTAKGSQIQYNYIGSDQIQFRVTLGSDIGGFSIGNWGLMDSNGNLITITALSAVEVKNATSSTNAGDNRVFSITITMDQAALSNLDLSVISLGAASLPEEATESGLPTPATSSYPAYHIQNYNSTNYPALASRANGNWYYYLPVEELNGMYVHQGNGIGQTASGTNTIYIGWTPTATGLKATVDTTDLGIFAFQGWVNSGFLNLSSGGNITGTSNYKGTEIVNTNTLNTGLSKKVTNNAGTNGGVTALDLDSDGSGRLAFASSLGWQIVQPAGDYATTSWVNSNFVTLSSYNYNINQRVLTTSSPTFSGITVKSIGFNNGGTSSVYQDTNTGDVVIAVNNGTYHYNVFNPDGSVQLGGALTCGQINSGGDIRTGASGVLYTNTVGTYGGTLTVNGNLNLPSGCIGYLNTTPATGDYGTRIANTTFVQNSIVNGSGLGRSNNVPGYTILPGGWILQAGNASTGDGGYSTVNFPISFPNRCIAVVATEQSASGTWTQSNPTLYGTYGTTTSSCTIYGMAWINGNSWSGRNSINYGYIAIGY